MNMIKRPSDFPPSLLPLPAGEETNQENFPLRAGKRGRMMGWLGSVKEIKEVTL